ncbi:AraC family transcriptional regulator [Arthrobacter sp. NPDC089319]|uniref:AraC family transcriptional regulator n=1 Tax=Arthrobacter sp. NPDC089319 TaxID=3155915 RepID=UPI0034204AF3
MTTIHTVTHPEVFSSSKALVRVQNSLHTSDLLAHGHDFAEIVFVRDGRAHHNTQAGSLDIRSGSVVTLGPNSWHAYQTHTRLKLSVLYLSTALLDHSTPLHAEQEALRDVKAPGQVTARRLTAGAFTAMASLADRFREVPGQTVFAELGFFYQVLDCLASTQPYARFSSTVPSPGGHSKGAGDAFHSVVLTEAVGLLRDRLNEDWNIHRLAAQVALSPGHLSRLFKQEVGHSPIAFLNQLRAEQMARILRSETATVASAGRAVGWPDPSYATRRFASHWGITPTAYRKRAALVTGQDNPRRAS